MLPHWKDEYVLVNGEKFHYVRTGSGTRIPLVLAHGFSDNGMCWLPLAQALEKDYDVILPDARGHGLSPRVQPDEMVDRAADLAGFIEALGLQRPIVGGHSMGGSTAGAMAARYPRLARALILEDPGWHDPAPVVQAEPEASAENKQPPANPWFDWLKSLPNQTLEEVMAHGKADNPNWPEVEWPAWAESKKQLDVNVVRTHENRVPWREVVKAIPAPTLLLTADPARGAIVTAEMAAEIEGLNPHVRVVNIKNAGHNIRRENFADYVAAVRAFLKDL